MPGNLVDAGIVDELSIIIAPVVLGGGKRLFEGFSKSLDLEHLGVRQSPFATIIDYSVKRPDGCAQGDTAVPRESAPRNFGVPSS